MVSKKSDWKQKISNLPTGYLYFLFFAISYASLYFSFIQGEKIKLGHDSTFHLTRIEALYRAISKGDIFPKITYFFAEGMGYAASIFYSDIFLYPAAFLRLAGFSLGLSYMYYLVIITFFTFLSSFYSFHFVSQSKAKSVLFALLYGLSSYRGADVVVRGALGESLALIFLPIAFAGLIQIVRGNEKNFYILSLGMAGLFFSHVLSTIIFSIFIVGYLLLNSRLIMKEKKRILYLAYATLVTVLMVAVNLFPIIEQLTFQKLKVDAKPIFFLQPSSSAITDYIKSAFLNEGHNNLGWLIFLVLLVLILRITKITTQNKQFLFLGIVFIFLATDMFPHYLFHDTPLNAIQFPWRYFLIVTICITWAFADSFLELFSKHPIFIALCIACFSLIGVIQYQLANSQEYRIYYEHVNVSGRDLGAGAEYLPAEMDYQKILTEKKEIRHQSSEIKLSKIKRTYNTISFEYDAKKPTKVTLPIIYYKGYKTKIIGSGKSSSVKESENFRGLSELMLSGTGKLKFWYEKTIVQKLSFWVTIITWAIFIFRRTSRKLNIRHSNFNEFVE